MWVLWEALKRENGMSVCFGLVSLSLRDCYEL